MVEVTHGGGFSFFQQRYRLSLAVKSAALFGQIPIARFYNKRDLTEECCRLNDFNNYAYIEVDENLQWSKLPTEVNFLFSNRGIGCHWPLNLYESTFPKILKDGATCIFMNGEVLGEIPGYFSKVAVVQEKIQDRELIVLRYNA